jgi:hypothetical protein
MFYCEPCRKKWRWPMSMHKSKGRCEICNHLEACYDVPSRHLPDPIGILTEEEVANGQAQG